MSRRRATPTPLLESFLELDLRGPTMQVPALLAIPDEPKAPHRAEAVLVDFRNFCGSLDLGFPLKLEQLADYLEQFARAGKPIEDLRLRARILIGVDDLWRRLPQIDGRLRIPGDDFSDVFILLDDYECKSVYDFVGVAFFDAHQTWGETALGYRRARAAFLKEFQS